MEHKQPRLDLFIPKIMKILRKFLTYLRNLYFMAKFWRLKMIKRFRFGNQDLITNPNPKIICLAKNHESDSEYLGFRGKDSNPNPNPNILYNTVLFALSPKLRHHE